MEKEATIADLKVWQKARDLAKTVYDLSDEGKIAKDEDAKSRLRTLSLAILTNITKGYERKSRSLFAKYLASARTNCVSLKAFMYVLLDLKKISEEKFSHFMNEATDISKMSSGLIKTLKADKAPKAA